MPLSQNPYAVIDIGSNSVRMVVFHSLSRVPMPLFNEKYYCGLARNLSQTGVLNPEGTKLARQAIARFALMLERFGITQVHVIATAAVRDARDGRAFVAELEAEFGLNIAIIDGEREADLAAKGILSSFWKPTGLVADLGGGSLELAYVEEGNILHRQSFPMGTLRLTVHRHSPRKLREAVRGTLQQDAAWLKHISTLCCYAIGGSFRSIAKMHSRSCDYPLKLIHEYRLKAETVSRLSRELCAMKSTEIALLPGIPGKRAGSIRSALILLEELLGAASCQYTLFSVSGIREGVMYDLLPDKEKAKDPLLASAEALAQMSGRKGRYAEELFGWMQPIFRSENDTHARLRLVLCHLSEIAWNIDPNFRGEWAYLRIIQSDMKGLSHRQRVTLACALYYRYCLKWKREFPETALMDAEDWRWAQCAGLCANLAFQLSGGKHGNLYHASLKLKDGLPSVDLDADSQALFTESAEKRLLALRQAYAPRYV